MYSIETISPLEFTMACIVCIGYISGKLWMYYNHTKESKPNKGVRIKSGRKSKGTIKRGPE